jgi:hypothetical protein
MMKNNNIEMELNVNAEPFYPPGVKKTIMNEILCQRKKLEEERIIFDRLDKMWWYQNKSMFDDSFEDINRLLKDQKLPYEESRGKRMKMPSPLRKVLLESIPESTPTYADILMKN